jgi:signal transduction histidine kinase
MVRSRPSLPHLPPAAVDVGIAAAVGFGALMFDLFGPDHRASGAAYWDVALALPLVFRRRAPALAAAAIGALCFVQWLTGILATGDAVALVMLYSLGAWEARRWVLTAAVIVAELGVIMAVTRWAPSSHGWLSALMATGTVSGSWILGIYVRTRRAYLASMIERAETAEQDRDSRAKVAVEAERARMAREMHDIITHSLSVMITLNDAAAAVTTSDDVRGTVTQASEVGRQALTEMQRMLGVLRSDAAPELTPQPGTAQLSDLISIVRSAGLVVELSITGTLTGLAATAELTIYRIVQESLTNVLKHGRNVGHVTVGIMRDKDRVTVRIHDDGDLVDRGGLSQSGHGLVGMRERAALYGGRLDAAPAPSGGWLVIADLEMPDFVATP